MPDQKRNKKILLSLSVTGPRLEFAVMARTLFLVNIIMNFTRKKTTTSKPASY